MKPLSIQPDHGEKRLIGVCFFFFVELCCQFPGYQQGVAMLKLYLWKFCD